MTVYFVSDLHLDPSAPRVIDAFRRMLEERVVEGDELYILGDLFEVWVGDDDDAPWVRSMIETLHAASGRIRIALLHGNRDFLIGSSFAAETGATLLPDPTLLERYGRRILLSHGDAWCTADIAYQQARQLFRSPGWQAEVRARPLVERREMARTLRAQSRATNANKPDNIMDVTWTEVAVAVRDQRADLVIHGHTHRPAIHPVATNGRTRDVLRYVLGDWDRCGWRVRLDESGVTLERFAVAAR